MTATHAFTLGAVCPVNGDNDHYECRVTVRRAVTCEEVQAVAAGVAGRTLYQEELTQRLADRLAAEVTTVGWHRAGDTTLTVTCTPNREWPAWLTRLCTGWRRRASSPPSRARAG